MVARTRNEQRYTLSFPVNFFSRGRLLNHLFGALKNPFSYNPFRNPFTLFGVIWGLPVPVFCLYLQASLTTKPVIEVLFQNPIQWFFMSHPLLFGSFFGVVGSLYYQYHERLKFKATHDELTGLLTHSEFHRISETYIAGSNSEQDELSIIMIDLDDFKEINDTLGHQAGDRVLETVASILEDVTRPGDCVCRYGGEEFAIALPRTSCEEAYSVAERLRGRIATNDRSIPKGMTLSAGVSEYPEDGGELDEVINRADACLYKAKAEGRNRTIYSPQLRE